MISFSTGSLYKLDLEKIFQIAHLAGFKYLELGMEIKPHHNARICWNIKKLKNFEKKYQLKIISLHAVPGLDIDYTDYFNKIIIFAKKMKIKYIIFHTPKLFRKNYVRWFGDFYLKQVKRKDIILLTENMGTNDSLYNSMKELKKFPNLVFDAAHALKSKENVLKMIKNLPNIRELHLSDYCHGHCHQNILDNKKLFQKILLASNKSIIKCIELCPEVFGDLQNQDNIVKILIEIRKFLEVV